MELLVSLEAGGDFVMASLNGLYLVRLAQEAPTPARTVGAAALAVVNAGLALEAVVFLSEAPLAGTESLTRTAAVLAVRSVLLVSAGLVSLLIWRSVWRRR